MHHFQRCFQALASTLATTEQAVKKYIDFQNLFQDPIELSFLRSALKLYQTVAGGTEDFIIELLTEFLEADHNHRSFIRSLLIEQGLQVFDFDEPH